MLAMIRFSNQTIVSAMNGRLILAVVTSLACAVTRSSAQTRTPDIPYVDGGHQRQVLDIYTPSVTAG